MTKICFLLLVHKDVDAIIEQASYLTQKGDYVVLHIDKNAPRILHRTAREALSTNDKVAFVKPVRAGWGDWSLSKAALRMISLGLTEFPDATHFYHLSGDCMPIRSREDLVSYLSESRKDLIETAEFYNGGWIKTGPHLERIEYYHFVNERKHKSLFYFLYRVQAFLGIKRKVPEELAMAIGSQWWCLRRSTVQRIRLYMLATPSIERFFKRSWIPDEILFQTLVNTIVPPSERESRPPTFLYFSDYGMPLVFSNDHYNFLIQQDSFFARKISADASELRERLSRRYLSSSTEGRKSELGKRTLEYTIYAGRVGRRFAPAVWKVNETLPSDSVVYVIAAKKWHVGERLAGAIAEEKDIPEFGYVFENTNNKLPFMGGIEKNKNLRNDSPIVFLNALLKHTERNEIIICVDPSSQEVLAKIASKQANIRMLEVHHRFTDDYLDGHANRIGIMVPVSAGELYTDMLTTIRENFAYESRELQTLGVPLYRVVDAHDDHSVRARVFGEVFQYSPSNFKTVAAIELED